MGLFVDCKTKNPRLYNRDNIVTAYFNDIRLYPILSNDDMKKLLLESKSSNPILARRAKNRIVESNQRFVVSIARRWQNGRNLMDVVNEANIGLMEAIDHYDLKRNVNFLTYAIWWIRKSLNEYINTKDKMIIPKNAQKLSIFVPKAKNDFFKKHNRYPDIYELKDFLLTDYNVKISHVESLQTFTTSSIDEDYFEATDEKVPSKDMIEYEMSTATNNVEDDLEVINKKEIVEHMLSSLPKREQDIMRMFFGIGCQQSGLVTIASQVGLTSERVRQIIIKAIRKLQIKYNKGICQK